MLTTIDHSLVEKRSDKVSETFSDTAKKTALVYQTISKLNEEIQKKVALDSEDRRLIAGAKNLKAKLEGSIPQLASAPVPGYCHYNGKDYLVNVVAIAEKERRVENAIKTLKALSETDSKVRDYFQRTLAKLKQGTNVPLPDFFHATRRAGLEGILQTQTIRQSSYGAYGPGVYVSNNNEGTMYGSYAFAIDERCFARSQAHGGMGRNPWGEVHCSFWFAVAKDIPITEESVAFIDTAARDAPSVKALLRAKNLNIEVVDRTTSQRIHKIFDLSTQRRELPSFQWRRV